MAATIVALVLIGDTAGVLGRRPAYVVTLGFFVTANTRLSLAKSYSELLGPRVLQALRAPGTVLIR